MASIELFQTKYIGYKISKCGKIWSDKSNKFLSPFITTQGYFKIRINKKHVFMHRLVLETFVTRPDNTYEVDHIDCNKLNNNITNLRWVTKSENNKKRKFNGNLKKLSKNQVEYIKGCKHKSQIVLARELGISATTIRRIIKNNGYKR